MGARLLLDKILAPALAAAGLHSPEALLRLGGDPEATSLVAEVELPVEGTVGRFHLKRYRYPDWGKSRGLLGRGTLFGTAPELAEFKNLAFLREKGIPAVRPVAAAAVTSGLRLVAHALLTEHVPDAPDLARRLSTPGDPVAADVGVRHRVAELIGRNIFRMHSEGFVHRDLFARNVLVRVDEDGPAVWFCDCRRGGPPGMGRKAVDDLASLDGDLKGRWSRAARVRVVRTYAGPGADIHDFCAEIARRRDALAPKA
jgi:hypothetical protein